MLKLRVRSAMTETSSEVGVKDPVSLCPRVGQLSLLSSRSASEKSVSQWFGIDIGGTLVKCVYFETQSSLELHKSEEREAIAATRKFLKSAVNYGSTGKRDVRLEMELQELGGKSGLLHFIKFATGRMDGFMNMVTENGLGKFPKIVCATGGGAFKFEKDFREKLGVDLVKYDEMECLIKGLDYLCRHYSNECYFWEDPAKSTLNPEDRKRTPEDKRKRLQERKKVPFQLGPNPFPCIIVNIGSGVSVLLVESVNSFKRIGGTSVGGGTFVGLCALLAKTESFEDAIALAEEGDSEKVDRLVRDIYGGDYDKLGLGGDVVASSFGHMVHLERRMEACPEDLARACLVTVTNNIGAIARMCASISGVERVVYVGNYLCGNELSMQMLAYAMDYWSQGTIKALFLEHEGYFGALGALLHHLSE